MGERAATSSKALSGNGPMPPAAGSRRAQRARRQRARSALPAVVLVIDVLALTIAFLTVPLSGIERGVFVVAATGLLLVAGSYRSRLTLNALDDLPKILAVAVVLALGGVLLLNLEQSAPGVRILVSVLLLVALGRSCAYLFLHALRRRGAGRQRAVIVGAGGIGRELHDVFTAQPRYGVDSIGLVDDVPDEDGLPLVAGIGQISDALDSLDVDLVVVAFGPRGEQELVSVLRAVHHRDVEIMIVPRFFELGLAPSGPEVESVWGIPLYRLRRSALRRWTWPVKRTTDVAVAGLLLVLAAPVMAAVAVAVRASSPGPVLFRQRRIGQHGRLIEVLKFRTMRLNSDSDVTWSVAEDPRITPVGRWLRRLSLDELPQLINVVRGDMSMVGPRPERPHFVDRFSQEVAGYSDRHRVPAGLTGYAQIHGLRGDTSISERARFDNAYVEHWTPWLDAKIVLQTMVAVIRDAFGGENRSEVLAESSLRERRAVEGRSSQERAGGATDAYPLQPVAPVVRTGR